MANRVLLGNRATGGYGLYVSKANSNVLTCDIKDLLLDSREKTSGMGNVYSGGSGLSLSASQDFLTTGSKDNLGYIPLVVTNETRNATWNYVDGNTANHTYYKFQSNLSMFAFTSSTLTPCRIDAQLSNASAGSITESRRTSSSDTGGTPTGGSQACVGLNFVVLKIPCAYGYMTSTYF